MSKGRTMDPAHFFGPLLYQTVFPLMLIVFSPVFLASIVYTNKMLDGDMSKLVALFTEGGVMDAVSKIWVLPSAEAWTVLISFVSFEAFLMLNVPGKTHRGPLTATGHVPVYIANGMQTFVITMATLYGIHFFELYQLSRIYDLFGEILSASNLFSLAFCAFLVLKGRIAPSSTDNQISNNPIFDYFWGVELYPRFGQLDLKTLVNCRVGMMGWPILLVCFLLKQQELNGGEVTNSMYISVAVQLIYIAKFFWWETGYFDSIDIMHDRFGFYICWGCLNWLPALYTNCTYFLVNHFYNLPTLHAYLLFGAGVLAVAINYAIDEERQRFRRLNGNINTFGKPATFLVAKYSTSKGDIKETKLLTSGWWGLSRHLNYVAELCAAFLWTPPVQFVHLLPYSYFIFLCLLLVHRSFRDDIRCSKKYGPIFEEYKRIVPYRMIPGLF